MITIRKLNDAIKEAVRFIKVAEKAKDRICAMLTPLALLKADRRGGQAWTFPVC